MTRSPLPEFWPAALVALGCAILFVVAANAGWPGESNSCLAAGACFCEAPGPGWVRQPSNTWSNLGFVLVGLVVAWHAAHGPRFGAIGVQGNRMTRGGMYPALYAAIVVFMGPGSMYFHASLTRWGGILDVLSMYLFISFVVTYAIARGWGLSQRGFLLWFVGTNVAIGVPQAVFSTSNRVFGYLVTVAIVLEGLLIRRAGGGAPWLPGPAPMNHVKLPPEQVRAGVEILRSHFDEIILDLPHDIEPGTISALEASDTILFLVSQNVSALRLGTAGLAAFRHLGLDLKKVKLVVMRERTGEDVTLKQVQEMIEIPIYWKMPSDHLTVVSAINTGKPLVTALPRSKIAKSLRQLSDTLADQEPAELSAKRSVSLLRRLWNPSLFFKGAE